jgi:hypothetical protein
MEMLPPFKIHNDYLKLSSWMDGQFSLISDRKLSQIALPDSCDSGINGVDRHSCHNGGSGCNTVAQDGNISYQLERGV